MGNTIYYCEVLVEDNWEFSKGVFAIPYRTGYYTKIQRCISFSNRVWRQGPRGGVKIIKDRKGITYGYVTKNEELMKEFMWVKLKAQTLSHYT